MADTRNPAQIHTSVKKDKNENPRSRKKQKFNDLQRASPRASANFTAFFTSNEAQIYTRIHNYMRIYIKGSTTHVKYLLKMFC